ncbi:DsrE family protein [Hydrogenothermus marinus]|uniref:tRNA 2-thiouridine synthesizing protein D n=1 Tax=Hydrogenothermus marinus TaxID=133270 RepID=A0A3M0C253_9AQUI|nr:DsrE family protein [Hydrogenothermus marinus]RMA97032.1 tRNA 2-thiouridine synthesizing protein D [Hydrogenothermus marinus]
MKLLFIMASNPYSNDFNTLVKMSQASLSRKHETSIFFMGNGLYSIVRDEIKQLVENGAKAFYCAHNAEQRKIKPESWAESSSMYGLAKLIKEADKVIILD